MSTSSISNNQHEKKTEYFTSKIASKYVRCIFQSPLHNEWMSSLLYNALELQPGHRLVDMGCGPALESMKILNKMNNQIYIIGVDSSQDMLDVLLSECNANPKVAPVCMDAVTFSQSTEYSPYDRIFLKDMIHLLARDDRLKAFNGFYKQLAPRNGRLLIIHGSIDGEIFPFDQRTKSLFRQGNDIETLSNELRCAGFEQIEQA